MPLSVGTRLGNYEIVGLLGKGGMAEVYHGKDTKVERDVAIKVLPAAFAQHPERLARFEREAKVLASLNHPNVAAIYAVEESSDGKALVMDLVKGETLKIWVSAITRRQPWPEEAEIAGTSRQLSEFVDCNAD
jgi:eukaryotic-like serine/threonine-protein kinase